MILAVLHYPALADTVEDLRLEKERSVPFFENEIPGLIDKTWGICEETDRGVSVYHFEDRASADAWFNSERQIAFREKNSATLEIFEVAAVAFRRPLRKREAVGV